MSASLAEKAAAVAVRRSLDWLDVLSRHESVSVAAHLAICAEATVRVPLRREGDLLRRLGFPAGTARDRRVQERHARAERDPRWAPGGIHERQPVFWHEGGPARPDKGRPADTILLLNGWTASGLLWPKELVRLLECTHRVIRLDNRGTGWSRTAASPFTLADLADDAARVLRHLETGPVTAVGFSMGGMIAQELALRHPALVTKLVLVGTRPPAPTQILPSPDAVLPLLDGPADGQPMNAYLSHLWSYQTGAGFADRKPDVLAELVRHQTERPTPMTAVRRQMQAISAWHGSDRLRRLDVRTDVVHGGTDNMMPIGNGLNLARLIPGSTFYELPGVGHLVPFEEPAFLADITTRT